MSGWRKRTIMEMAREAGFEQVGHDSSQEFTARMEAFAALVREEVLAQQERNFCPRCGKRTKDIHTCTPPQENT
jgi:hypothetical protein